MSKVISNQDFAHIVQLSNLEIKPEESFLKDQLSQTAEYIKILDELDTQNVVPTFQVNHKKNVFRSDEVGESLSQDSALSQALQSHQGYFKTKATIKK